MANVLEEGERGREMELTPEPQVPVNSNWYVSVAGCPFFNDMLIL